VQRRAGLSAQAMTMVLALGVMPVSMMVEQSGR
jgi:hypothetical protein